MGERIASTHSTAVFAEAVSRLLNFATARRRALLEPATSPEAGP
jgi:hypothetical protein